MPYLYELHRLCYLRSTEYRVHPHGRFIQDQEVGVVYERHRERQPPLLPTTKTGNVYLTVWSLSNFRKKNYFCQVTELAYLW